MAKAMIRIVDLFFIIDYLVNLFVVIVFIVHQCTMRFNARCGSMHDAVQCTMRWPILFFLADKEDGGGTEDEEGTGYD